MNMAVDVKRLNEAERIDLTRALAAGEKAAEEARMNAELLAAATISDSVNARWFALRTAHRSEIALCESLRDSHVDAVVPQKKVHQKRRAGCRGKFIHKPVLPHLVFVRMVPSNEAFAGLLRVKGVAAVIGSGGRPHPISEREMSDFMDLAQKGAFDERLTPTGWKVGSKVRIKDGPFADFKGVLEGYARKRGVRVLTHLFGQAVTVELTLAQIELL
jgi:transcription termination/antitermination protein NusG